MIFLNQELQRERMSLRGNGEKSKTKFLNRSKRQGAMKVKRKDEILWVWSEEREKREEREEKEERDDSQEENRGAKGMGAKTERTETK